MLHGRGQPATFISTEAGKDLTGLLNLPEYSRRRPGTVPSSSQRFAVNSIRDERCHPLWDKRQVRDSRQWHPNQ